MKGYDRYRYEQHMFVHVYQDIKDRQRVSFCLHVCLGFRTVKKHKAEEPEGGLFLFLKRRPKVFHVKSTFGTSSNLIFALGEFLQLIVIAGRDEPSKSTALLNEWQTACSMAKPHGRSRKK